MALGTPTNKTSGGNSASAGSNTTASFTPTAGALILAVCAIARGSNVPTTIALTTSITGLVGSWTEVTIRNTGGSAKISLFYIMAGASPSSGTITFTYSGGTNPIRQAWIVDEVTGADPTTPISESNTNQTTGTTLSSTLGGIAGNNKAYGACMSVNASSITVGSGETEILESSSGGASEARLQTEYGTTVGVDWSGLDTTIGSVGLSIEIAEANSDVTVTPSVQSCTFSIPTVYRVFGTPTTKTHSAKFVRSSSQALTAPDSPALSIAGDFTYEGWLYLDSLPTSGQTYGIIMKGNPAGTDYAYNAGYVNNAGTLQLSIGGSTTTKTYNVTLPTQTWFHLAFSITSGATLNIYINGILVSTQTSAGTVTDTIATLYIGRRASNYWNGKMAEIRLWDTLRTASQIQAGMFQNAIGNESGLRACWHLDNTLTDETINNSTLTNVNTVTFDDHDIPYRNYAYPTEQISDSYTMALYHLNNSLSDDSGNSLNLTAVASPAYGVGFDGLASGAIDLESSSSQYLYVADNALLDITGDTGGSTLEAVFTLESLPSSGNAMAIVAKWGSADNQRGYGMYIKNNAGTYQFQYRTSDNGTGEIISTVDYAFTIGVKYYIAVIHTSSQVSLYLNGILIDNTLSGEAGKFNSSSALAIGASKSSASATDYFDGIIDEVKISNIPRTEEDIMKFYGGIARGYYASDANPETVSVDGQVQRAGVDESLSTLRSASGNGSGDLGATQSPAYMQASTTSNQYQSLTRGIFLFDTSKIPDANTILRGALRVYVSTLYQTLTGGAVGMTAPTPASNTALVNADYNIANHGSTELCERKLISEMITSASNFLVLNSAGRSAIAVSGITKLATRLGWDIDNSAPTWGSANAGGIDTSMADNSAVTQRPYLLVETTGSPNVTVTPAVQSCTFSIPTKTVNISVVVAPAVQSCTFSIPTKSVVISVSVAPAVQSATFSIPTYTITTSSPNVTVSATVASATFSIPTYTVATTRTVVVSATVASATFSIPTYTVDGSISVSPAVQSATFSIPSVAITTTVSIAPAVQVLTFSVPSRTVTGTANISVAPAVQVLTFSTPAYSVSTTRSVTISASVIALLFSIPTYLARGDFWQDKFGSTGTAWSDKLTTPATAWSDKHTPPSTTWNDKY